MQWVQVSRLHEVSPEGVVRNIHTKRPLKSMRTGSKRAGAQRSKVRFSTNPRVDRDVAHLVLETFIGPRPPGAVAMHLNNDSTDNRVGNLRWGTPAENTQQTIRDLRGGSQKLTPEQAADVARRRAAGERGRTLAREYGISEQRVCDIYKGRVVVTTNQGEIHD